MSRQIRLTLNLQVGGPKGHGQQFRSHIHALARAAGRDPDKIIVLPGLFVILGGTEAEAHARMDALDAHLDAEFLLGRLAEELGIPASELDLYAELPYDLFNNLTGGQRVITGTPEQVADGIVDWVDSGASDGFTINIDVQTEGFETFVDGVVGELRRRDRLRREYEYQTFRENLGVA
jgi:alkanesulfonate monooxygenase SsuD/methylene tetrahydromethanopterin reductase-like flavin-dependent oxidoreductase (luciferase family)